MKCLIIDDEPLALTQLSGYISRIPFLTLVASCQDACQASKYWLTLLLTCFCRHKHAGPERYRFCTLASEPSHGYLYYCILGICHRGFRLNAIDYLMKPFSFAECLRAAEKARQMYGLTHNTAEPEEEKSTLFVKSEYKVIRIDKEKILYIEGMSEYVCIYMEDRPKPVITLNSLQKLSAMLPPNFMRVHRSYIVNLNKITEISRFRILFGKDVYIPIGENYKEQFMAYIHRLGLI